MTAEGITIAGWFDGAHVHLAEAKESFSVVRSLNPNGKALLLVDMGRMKAMDRDARSYYAGTEVVPLLRALALVVPSTTSRVIGNVFLGLNRNLAPTKLFNTRQDAVDWLLTDH